MEFPLFDVDDVDGVDDDVEPFCPGLYPRRPAAARVKNRRALAAQAGKIQTRNASAAQAGKIYENSNRKSSSCKRKLCLHFIRKYERNIR